MLKKLGHNKDLEDVALTYIKQFLSIRFFQEFDGYESYATFKMHDLVDDLALLVAKHDCFNLTSQGFPNCFSIERVRHLSFPVNYFVKKEPLLKIDGFFFPVP